MIKTLAIKNPDMIGRISSGESVIEFQKGINLLIGENGSGKSTILNQISKGNTGVQNGDIAVKLFESGEHFDLRFVDMSEQGKNRNLSGYESDVVYRHSLLSHFKSHGESNIPILLGMKGFKSGTLVLVDEPELALDFENMVKFIKLLKKEQNRLNFIISTHSPLLINIAEAHCVSLSQKPSYKERLLKAYGISSTN